MSASVKIRQLEPKLLGLQNQYQHLLKERQQEIAVLLSIVDLAHLDDKTLMGAFLFLKDKITTQDPIMEAWQAAGEKFLRQHKPRSLPRSQPCQGKISAGKSFHTANKKHFPSKQAHTHQTTSQLPQEHSQQGEE